MARIPLTRRRLALIGVALALSFALMMLAAESAQALPPIGSLVDKAARKIFGVKFDGITGTFVQWLIRIPDVGLTADSGGPHDVFQVTRDIAFATLAAVVTLACVHYLVSGMTGQGGGTGLALDGMLRSGGAAMMILAWPFLVDEGVGLAHIASDVLVPGHQLGNITKALLIGGTLGALWGGVPTLIAIIVMIAFALIILVILTTKVMLGAMLICIASGMPLALALWPIPSLSWLASGLGRWCAGIVTVQIAWAVELGLYARVPADFIKWRGAGPVVDHLISPLTMIALLLLMLSTARSILRLAGLPTSGGGFVSNTASLMAGRFMMNAVSRHVPDRFGGSKDTIAQRAADATYRDLHGAASDLASAHRARSGAARAGQAAERTMALNDAWMRSAEAKMGNNPQSDGSAGEEGAGTGGGRGPGGPPGGGPAGSGGAAEPPRPTIGHDGVPTRPGHGQAHRESLARMNGMRQAGPPKSPDDVADALDTLQASGLDADAVANHIGSHGHNDRHVMSRMADAELATGLSPDAAQAFRTIGIAEPSSRAAGLSQWQSRQAGVGPTGTGRPATESAAPSRNGGSRSGAGGSPTGNGAPPAASGGPRPRKAGPAAGNGAEGGGAGEGGPRPDGGTAPRFTSSKAPGPPLAGDGLPTRTGNEISHRAAIKHIESMRSPHARFTGPGEVAQALDTIGSSGLDAETVAKHLGAHGAHDRYFIGRMADAAIASGLSSEAAGAFRTLGIAEPNARAAGLSLWRSGQVAGRPREAKSTPPKESSASGRATRPAGPPSEP